MLQETRQRVAKKAGVAPAVGRKRNVVRKESVHDGAQHDLTKYLTSRGRITNDSSSVLTRKLCAPLGHAPVIGASTGDTHYAFACG